MDENRRVSLIDLGKQLPFEIDDQLKKEICFAETLVVSCGHFEGDIEDESSDSDWSCQETTETETSEDIKDDTMIEVNEGIKEETLEEEEIEEDDDFHLYFFPDCTKPLRPKNSKDSLMIVDGLPQINPLAKRQINCTCEKDKTGKCVCFTKLPCYCGAKTVPECTCAKAKDICICLDDGPRPVCTCKGSNVCMCHPEGLKAICTCDKVEKPCVCHPNKFPYPVCVCKEKPVFKFNFAESIEEEGENEYGSEVSSEEIMEEPCDCQKPDPVTRCQCIKGKECTCRENTCICDVQRICVCESTDSKKEICKLNSCSSICKCPKPKECTCDAESAADCKCFPKSQCFCGDPENCKCFSDCECTDPCICDTITLKEKECICLDKGDGATEGLICICSDKEQGTKKLKRVRAGKHGYRWCHDVDPKHTYFDYGYGRHNKISYKEPEREKIKILGLNEDIPKEDLCPIHGIIAPPYKNKTRKQSLDCCSAVGGISISIETLGEDKDKFLIQVVSHSSKEGAKTGSKLVSILDCNFHTMEENRTEHITKKDVTKERRSYMAICGSGYYNKVTRICGDRHVIKRLYHSYDAARNFLLEGANIILLRYLGLRRYRGNIKTETVLMDGTICESIYVSLGVSQAIVNGTPLFVVKVERHIIEPSGFIHQTLTVLSLRGYLVSHEWADNNYILHLNPLLRIIPEKDEIETHAPLREKWREDLQLLSDYLEFKSTRSSEGGRYVTESGALTATVRDYLQALLLLRPQDALHFTRHYFDATLSALDLPHDEYFDPTSKHVRYYFFEE